MLHRQPGPLFLPSTQPSILPSHVQHRQPGSLPQGQPDPRSRARTGSQKREGELPGATTRAMDGVPARQEATGSMLTPNRAYMVWGLPVGQPWSRASIIQTTIQTEASRVWELPRTQCQGCQTERVGRVSMEISWDPHGQGTLGQADGMGSEVGTEWCLCMGQADRTVTA